jgi:hypothetical protein
MTALALALVLAAPVQAATPSPVPTPEVQHAAATVAHLHDTMLDPPTFVLDGVFVTKPDKKGAVSYCYAYRSHNTMGGYSEGRAVEWSVDKGRLSTYSPSTESSGIPGYDTGWFAPCKAKNLDHEITADVAALAPSLYRKSK